MSELSESPESCPKCGVALPSSATAGLCPRCLMAEAMVPTQADAEPAAAPRALAPEELAPHFPQLEILEYLGRGGMGVVYKARQKSLNRLVALKLLAPERVGDAQFAERFTREAQALAALNHPNIVTVYDFGQAGGFYYLLMEYVDGLNLRQLLRTRRFTPEEALAIVPPLCDALQFAHDQGIVHRDIKPENLLLDKAGRVKVADFGIARMLGAANGGGATGTTGVPQSLTQSTLGTPAYSAPEQKSDPQRADSRADIYSLGVVFYELLTGELPGKPLQPPSRKVQIDVRLDEVVLHALEKEPERRYQQASQVKTAVETITQSTLPGARDTQAGTEPKTPSVPDPNLAQSVHCRSRRRFVRVALSIVLLLGISLGLLAFLKGRRAYQMAQALAAPKPVLAVSAEKGDISVFLTCVGSVESSNSALFFIPQNYVQEVVKKLDAGQSLIVIAYDQSRMVFGHGFLLAVDNKMDTETQMLKCKARLIPDGGNLMVPGMFLNIRMLLEVKHGVMRVPLEAIQRAPDSTFVFVIKADQTATVRTVRLGTIAEPAPEGIVWRLKEVRDKEGREAVQPRSSSGQWAEVQSGLAAGELVVIEGSNKLSEGRKVTYTLAQAAEAGEPSMTSPSAH